MESSALGRQSEELADTTESDLRLAQRVEDLQRSASRVLVFVAVVACLELSKSAVFSAVPVRPYELPGGPVFRFLHAGLLGFALSLLDLRAQRRGWSALHTGLAAALAVAALSPVFLASWQYGSGVVLGGEHPNQSLAATLELFRAEPGLLVWSFTHPLVLVPWALALALRARQTHLVMQACVLGLVSSQIPLRWSPPSGVIFPTVVALSDGIYFAALPLTWNVGDVVWRRRFKRPGLSPRSAAAGSRRGGRA